MAQRGQDGDGGVLSGGEIRNGHADLVRFAVGIAGDRHQSRLRLHDVVVARPHRARSVAAVAGDRAIHQARIDRRQFGETDAEGLGRARAVVLDQHVGLAHHGFQQRPRRQRTQVDGDRALVAVAAGEIRRQPVLERRAEAARIVAVERFELDDVGAEIGQHHSAPWARQYAGQFQDDDAGEGGHGGIVACANRPSPGHGPSATPA